MTDLVGQLRDKVGLVVKYCIVFLDYVHLGEVQVLMSKEILLDGMFGSEVGFEVGWCESKGEMLVKSNCDKCRSRIKASVIERCVKGCKEGSGGDVAEEERHVKGHQILLKRLVRRSKESCR